MTSKSEITEAYKNLEAARTSYMIADALYEALCEERAAFKTDDIDPQDEELNPELSALNSACISAIFLRSDARDLVVDAAVEFTKALSPKIARDPDLPKLWASIKTNPYSPTSKKAFDAIMRVRI